MIKVFVGDRVAMSDAFEIEGELSALQAFSVIPFTDSQPDGLGYSNGWTVGPEENRRQHENVNQSEIRVIPSTNRDSHPTSFPLSALGTLCGKTGQLICDKFS